MDWSRGRLKWDTKMVAGATPSTDVEEFWLDGADPDGTPFVAIADMSRRDHVYSTSKSLSADGLASRSMPVGVAGTLLLAMYASVGEVAFLDIEATWNQALLGITPNPEILDARFLRYTLLHKRDELLQDVRSNTQSNLNAGQIGDLWLDRPSPAEQQAISDFLDRETARIDTLIEEQERLIELLRERRQSMVERSVSALPWNTPLGAVSVLVQTGPFGSQLKSEEYEPGGTPIINPSHLISGRIQPDFSVAVSAGKAAELARHRIRTGDIVAARRGELGRCAAARESDVGYLCGTGSVLIRVDTNRALPDFVALAFGTHRNRDALSLASVGSTMENLNARIVASLRIPLPPVPEQCETVVRLRAVTRKVDSLISETERFIALARERRVALITAAVTGQIDVRDPQPVEAG